MAGLEKTNRPQPLSSLTRYCRHLPLLLLFFGQIAFAAERPGSVDDLIARAIGRHPSIAARRADLGAAQSGVEAARQQYYPTPTVQFMQDDTSGHYAALTVNQPLWVGGRLDAGLDAARSREDAARFSVQEARYALAARVINAWQSWLRAWGRANAMDQGLKLLNIYFESSQRRVSGGMAAESDRELVGARISQMQGDLASAQAEIRIALAQLTQMTGSAVQSESLAAALSPSDMDSTDADPQPPQPLEAFLERTLTAAPALRRLDRELEAARSEISQKRAALWPTLNLRAEHKQGSINGMDTNDRVMLVLEYAPGAGLSTVANADAAQSRAASVQFERDAAHAEITDRITADHVDFHTQKARRQEAIRAKKATAEVLASYDRQFIAGRRGWLDVLNVARELTQAQIATADTEAALAGARHRLKLHATADVLGADKMAGSAP